MIRVSAYPNTIMTLCIGLNILMCNEIIYLMSSGHGSSITMMVFVTLKVLIHYVFVPSNMYFEAGLVYFN